MTPSSVLVVKPSSLGDIVHTLPAVHFLKTTFPEAEFVWIANTEWIPLLEDNADLKAVIPFPRRQFRGFAGIFRFFQWCRELSHLEPDLVLDFQGLFRSAWISRSAKGKSVLGLSDSREGSRYHYHQRALVNADQHAVDRYLELAKLAGADISGPAYFPLPRGKPVPSLELPDGFVVLHPFARGANKSLTPEEILQFTRAFAPHPIVIVGRSRECFTVDRNGISLVNRTDLPQLIWLLRKAKFIVSVDSGPMHIAAAITSELLSIHTWSDPGLVGPYNPDAWVWKDQSIFQVRSIRSRVSSKQSDGRPDPAQIASFVRERLLQ
jgi:ADP-heptose:LPS heptosyltransferase